MSKIPMDSTGAVLPVPTIDEAQLDEAVAQLQATIDGLSARLAAPVGESFVAESVRLSAHSVADDAIEAARLEAARLTLEAREEAASVIEGAHREAALAFSDERTRIEAARREWADERAALLVELHAVADRFVGYENILDGVVEAITAALPPSAAPGYTALLSNLGPAAVELGQFAVVGELAAAPTLDSTALDSTASESSAGGGTSAAAEAEEGSSELGAPPNLFGRGAADIDRGKPDSRLGGRNGAPKHRVRLFGR